MSNYSALKTDINNNIYENNTQQITGTVLNTVLKDMVNTLGAGYQFAGCAYLDLNPGAPDAKVFYLAGEGLYTNFDNIQVPAGKLGILKWDTRWHLETIEGLGGGGANLTGYISVASTDDLPDEGQPTIGYLCGTNLYLYVGEGGDTKDGKYQNCGGFRGPEGVGITEIEQVEQSTENGGRNTIRIHLSNGSSYDVYTRNGTTSTGLFPTLEALQAAYPSPVVGQYAFVGAGFPADIYVCNTAGTWTDSGADYDGDSVDLTDYATKAELNQLEAEVNGFAKVVAKVYDDDSNDELNIGDPDGNVILQLSGGHIKTKNFDSSDLTLVEAFPLKNKTVAFLGDSITYGSAASSVAHRYVTLVGGYLQATPLNYGEGGSCIAKQSANDTTAFEERCKSISSSADLIVVLGGVNDFGGGHIPFGTFLDGYKSDTISFCAGMHRMCKNLRDTFPDTPVIISTPIHYGREYVFNNDGSINYEQTNADSGKTFREYVAMIKEVASFYAIPVADAFSESGLNYFIDPSDYNDPYHPTDSGHLKLAKYLANQITYLYKNF